MKLVSRYAQLAACIGLTMTTGACGSEGTSDEQTSSVSSPIIGGQPATEQNRLGTIAVRSTGANATFFCSGTLIAPTVVLTAAHCIVDLDDNGKVVGKATPDKVSIGAGPLDVNATTAEDIYPVAKVVAHANFPSSTTPRDADGLGAEDDVALLILGKPVTALPSIPVLPRSLLAATLTEGKTLTLTGYGARGVEQTSPAGQLYTAKAPFVRRSEKEFIAGKVGTPDTCSGDSGGPVYAEANGKTFLVGVTSRGLESATVECGAGGIYSLAPAYEDWIRTGSEGAYPPAGSAPDPGPGSNTGGNGSGTTQGNTNPKPTKPTKGTSSQTDTTDEDDDVGAAKRPSRANAAAANRLACSATHRGAPSTGAEHLAVFGVALVFASRRRRRR